MIGVIMMFLSIMFGLIFVGLGVLLFLLFRFFGSDTTVSCQENGFTVKVVNKRKGTSVHDYAWNDITETLYYEKESGGEDSTTTCYFQVKTANGLAFTLSEMKNFGQLIATFNQNTPQLPYTWEKPKGIIKSSYYQKQNRVSI